MNFKEAITRLSAIEDETQLSRFVDQLPNDGQILTDDAGSTLLHRAAAADGGLTALRLLVEKWGPHCLTLKDKQGNTPVHLIARHQNEASIKFVQKTIGADWKAVLYSKGSLKRTVFHYAAENEGTVSVLQWLVEDQGPACLQLEDEKCNTPLLRSLKRQGVDAMEFLEEKFGAEAFKKKDYRERAAIHFAAKNFKTNEFLKWLVKKVGKEGLKQRDALGNTPVHIAARWQDADTMEFVETELAAEAKEGKDEWSQSKGFRNQTVFHRAAMNARTDSVLQWLVEKKGAEYLNLRDSANTSAIHYSILYQNKKSLQFIEQKLGPECFRSTGYLNAPSICYAARNEDTTDTVDFIVEKAQDLAAEKVQRKAEENARRSDTELDDGELEDEKRKARDSEKKRIFLECDDAGRNFFHFCAFNCKFGVQLFQMAVAELNQPLGLGRQTSASSDQPTQNPAEKDAINRFVDKLGRTPLHYACLMKNTHFIKTFLRCIHGKLVTDAEGNTLLHAMFQLMPLFRYKAFTASELVSCVESVINSGVDPSAENARKHNCLMAAEVESYDLTGVITELAAGNLKSKFQKLIKNSEGAHAVHVFAGRYELHKILERLTDLSGKSSEQLLYRRVTSGQNKGATCLHFACEAAHTKNIKLLINKGLKLQDVTEDGQSCIDFACNKGRVDAALKAAVQCGLKRKDLLRLVDPPSRALQLPPRPSARNVLDTFVDSGATVEGVSIDEQMFRTLELDSTEILRSLLTLGYSIETDTDLRKMLDTKLQSETLESQHFPKAKKFVDKHKESDIFDFALHFSKVNVLIDLAVIRQFDLIPKCVTLLILLKKKIMKGHAKREQLSELETAVLAVVTNALDCLFDGDEDKKELVFRYLTADFEDGPRFQLRAQQMSRKCVLKDRFVDRKSEQKSEQNEQQWFSVLELLQKLNSEEIFATDCVSGFASRQWRRKAALPWDSNDSKDAKDSSNDTKDSSKDSKDGKGKESGAPHYWYSYNAKFYIYLLAFFIFLAFFAWFVIDFGATFSNLFADSVLCLYAVAFTAQEWNDFRTKQDRVLIIVLGRTRFTRRYFTEISNYFDTLALAVMWIGLILKWALPADSDDAVYICRMIMTFSFLLWGCRSMSLLSFFKLIGPRVSMLKSLLLRDLLSLLGLLAVIFYSFSIFFFSLLHPDSSSSSSNRKWLDVLNEIWTFPSLLAFGLFERDDLKPCNGSLAHSSWFDCTHDVGHIGFSSFFVFVFMLLVNIVMWNLLIALFSLTVARKENRALVIWRKNRFDLLREFEQMGFLPPPLSVLELIWNVAAAIRPAAAEAATPRIRAIESRVYNRMNSSQPTSSSSNSSWWQSDDWDRFPEKYKQFLQHQALQLRLWRPKLLRKVEKHRSDTEALKAFTENSIADSSELMSNEVATVRGKVTSVKEEVARVKEKVASVIDAVKNVKEETSILKAEMQEQNEVLQRQMDNILQLLHQMNPQQQQQQQQQEQQH